MRAERRQKFSKSSASFHSAGVKCDRRLPNIVAEAQPFCHGGQRRASFLLPVLQEEQELLRKRRAQMQRRGDSVERDEREFEQHPGNESIFGERRLFVGLKVTTSKMWMELGTSCQEL